MTTDWVGKKLGQYELVALIGEGGLASVYKAYQPSLKRWVAVKVLYDNYGESLARFWQEATTIARLRHRNILVIYEYGEAQGHPYLVMELVEQGTLKDYLTGTPMDWTQMVKLAIPVAEALHYAHGQGLIHRDVKPSNILMPQEDWPLLADFGLVKMVGAEQALTASGVVMGTPAYMSPEQVHAEKVDHRADIYALGVLMFEMITGRLPFEYENPHRLMLAHLSEPVPSPRQFNLACLPLLEEIILKMLQKLPDERYTDMGAVVNALAYVQGSSTASVSAAPRAMAMPARPPASAENIGSIQDSKSTLGIPSLQTARIRLLEKNVTIPLPNPGENGLIIGRSHGNNRVDVDFGPHGAVEMGISRQHARLNKQNGDWLIDDLGSLNGTFVDEVKLTPGVPVALKNGDIVRCSRLHFVFLLSGSN